MLALYFLEQPRAMLAVEEDLPLELKECQPPYPQMDLPQLEAGPQLSPVCWYQECQSYGDLLLHRQKGLLPQLLFVGELGADAGFGQEDCQRGRPLHWRQLCEWWQLAGQTG